MMSFSDHAPRILVVDDHPQVRNALQRVLRNAGYEVTVADDVPPARACLSEGGFDVVITDHGMPGGTGLDVLAEAHQRDAGLPVIFVTGAGDLEAAQQAIEQGALRYLVKPVGSAMLLNAVEEACRARAAVNAAHPIGRARVADRDLQRVALSRQFDSALDKLWVALQPVGSLARGRVTAYEALVRSDEPALANPATLLAAAEDLGRLHDIGRKIRAVVAAHHDSAPPDVDLLVNLHPCDLDDEDLFDPQAPLSKIAHRVILEITERASLDIVDGVPARIARLRTLGFRIAVDDLGAGYGSLSAIALIRPDLVKIDMSLVRDVDTDPVRAQMIRAIGAMCDQLGVPWLCEGVETIGELDALSALGADLLQGYLLGRPARSFAPVAAELLSVGPSRARLAS